MELLVDGHQRLSGVAGADAGGAGAGAVGAQGGTAGAAVGGAAGGDRSLARGRHASSSASTRSSVGPQRANPAAFCSQTTTVPPPQRK